MNILLAIITWSTIASAYVLTGYAQTPVPEDAKVREIMDLARRYMKTRNFEDAALTLEQVDKTKFNSLSTAAIYLSGIAWLEEGNKEKALSKFNRILNYYPESRYVQEAKYHKALILMNDLATREYGLKMMMDAGDNSKDKSLQAQSKDAISQFLFHDADIKFLDYYLKVARESYKNLVAEALCFQYIEKKQYEEIPKVIHRVDSTGKRLSPKLKLIREKTAGLQSQEAPTSQTLRVAVLMPFFAEDQDSGFQVSTKSLISVEFMEGMEMASKSYKAPFPLELYLSAWDVRRDSSRTRKMLNRDFHPDSVDVIVGSYYNNESRVIADWCEQNKVLQIVPYSPESYLISGRKQVFLASPSLITHARKMADYCVQYQGYKKIAVFTSDERIAKLLSDEFIKKAEALKAVVLIKKFSTNPEKAQTQIPDLVKQLAGLGIEAVYIPGGDEEMAGMILSNLKLNRLQPVILGSPEFRNFRAIDKELMDHFQILFSDAIFELNAPDQSEIMIREYANEYGQRLTHNVVRGYDLMKWILSIYTARDFNPEKAQEFIHKTDKITGQNQNFHFGPSQDNQSLFILRIEGRTLGKAHEY